LVNPFIVFYEKHPLEGVRYGHPLGTFTLPEKEVALRAEPYFFSNERSDVTLLYQWSLNGKHIQNQGRTITLRNDKGLQGNSIITLAMRGTKKTFQSGSKSVTLRFAKTEPVERPKF
jgi:hypothetical protein